MSNVWATMPYVQLSHKMFVICINNRQNQIFSEMSLRDVMELPIYGLGITSVELEGSVHVVVKFVNESKLIHLQMVAKCQLSCSCSVPPVKKH